MTDVFVLRNQHQQYLSKSLEWLAAGDSKSLYRTLHRDEIINQKVELTVKHPELRIQVVDASQANNGKILLNGEDCLPKANDSDGAENLEPILPCEQELPLNEVEAKQVKRATEEDHSEESNHPCS